MWFLNPWRRIREIQVVLTEVVNNQNELTKLQNNRFDIVNARVKYLEMQIRKYQ